MLMRMDKVQRGINTADRKMTYARIFNGRHTKRICVTTSFIINIDTLYTRKDTYVIEVRIARPCCNRAVARCIAREKNAVNVPVTKGKPTIKSPVRKNAHDAFSYLIFIKLVCNATVKDTSQIYLHLNENLK